MQSVILMDEEIDRRNTLLPPKDLGITRSGMKLNDI